MSLDAAVALTVGDLDLSIEIEAAPGTTVGVLGPNGAGKSTLIRALCGLEPIDAGRIVLDDRVLDEPSTATFVAARDRAVGVVFQHHLLFRSMSVLDNVAFGLRSQGHPKVAARAAARELVEAMGLGDRLDARPSTLSGGESQRVALARALATSPRLLLMDEPLAALDATTRVEIRRELRHRLGSIEAPRLLVTHDPVDAYALADEVVIIEGGRVTQRGTLADVAARPRSPYVADLIGVNLFAGTASAAAGGGATVALDDGGELSTASSTVGPVFALVHPRSIALHRDRPSGSPRNVFHHIVDDVDLERDRARIRTAGPPRLTAEITAAAATELAPRPGDPLWLSIKATEVDTYPR